jgi:hypothetical protein
MLAAAFCVGAVAGCAGIVDGDPVRKQAVGLHDVLPSANQVAQAVGNPLDPTSPPMVGGIALLPNGIRNSDEVSPLECLGAATPLMRVVYERGDVRAVGLQDFSRYGEGLTVSSAHTGVVRFGSEAEAARTFDAFARQWRSCAGTLVRVPVTETSALEWTITDVREADGIVSATVLNGQSARQTAFPIEHAIGLVGEYIIDVDVAVTDADPSRRAATGRAARLVGLIRDNIDGGR